MKFLIFGGCGFVGANLARYFSEQGNTVIAFDNLSRRGSELNIQDFKRRGIKFIHGDIRNNEDFSRIPSGIDVICECSAQPSVVYGYDNPMYDFTCNTSGAVNVLEYARNNKCMVLFWSTNKTMCGNEINLIPFVEKGTRYEWTKSSSEGFDSDYGISETFPVDGGDHSIYGVSKLAADLFCQEYAQAFNMPIVIFRNSCLYGKLQWGKPEQGWLSWWIIAHELGLPLKYIGWEGKQVRDVLYARDICSLIEATISNISNVWGEVFTIGGGINNTVSLIEATDIAKEITGKEVPVVVEKYTRTADQCIYISDIRKAKRLLNWEPEVSVRSGLKAVHQWVVENKKTLESLYL